MPIEKARLDAYIAEITSGMDPEKAKAVTSLMADNPEVAERSVNGWLRHSDYTRKTQELSQQREQLESSVQGRVQEYAVQLQQAEQKIAKIMDDFEKAHISEAQANARLLKLKEIYRLSDDDVPPVNPVAAPPSQRGGQPGPEIDIDRRLESFKVDLVRTLMPEMIALTRVGAIQNDIWAQHGTLTGKPMTDEEMFELIRVSEKEKRPLKAVWEDKYEISRIRAERSDGEKKDKWRKEWEAEQAQRRSEEALAGVRNRDQSTGRFSPVIGRSFDNRSSDPAARAAVPDKSGPVPASPNGAPAAPAGPKLTGAERAAAKWMERRAAGIAPGTPIQNNQ